MKLLVVACLLAVASARPSEEQLGTERCTWGPAYWCKNYKQAIECNAIAHCKEHVWKSNDLCSECESAVKQVHDFAQNNGTEVLAYMKELCTLVGKFAEECSLLVDLYGKTVLSTIVELTADSEKLCKELGLCSDSESKQEIQRTIFKVFIKQLKASPHVIHIKSVKGDYCEDCKLVFAEVKDLLEDKAIQGDIVGLLEKLCAEFGSYATECKGLVDQYGPLVFEELASLDDPDSICAELGLCNSTKKVLAASRLTPAKLPKLFFPMAPGPVLIDAKKLQKAKKIKSPKVSVECVVCEYAMKELDGILGDNATKEEIQEALDEVCSILPSIIRSECQDLVNEYGPMIIKLLLEQVQPDRICTELGLCAGAKKLVRVALHKDFKTNDGTCELCKLIIGYLEDILKSNATEDEIKKALEEVCDMLPSALKTECKELVDKYTADLVWLVTEVPPYSACKCNAIVKEYGDLIIKLILGEISPQEVCQALGLCESGVNSFLKYKCFLGESYWCANYRNALKCQATDHCKFLKFLKFFKSTKSQETPVVKDSKFCQECKNAVNYLGNLFPKNTSKQQILNGLKAFCSRFEPSLVKDCDDIIERYGDIIVKLLQGKVNPETFCEKLHLCKASKKAWLKMKCYLGKSYWCKSYQNALDCQALEHCQFSI